MDFLKSAVSAAIAKGPLSAYSVGDRVDIDASIWTLSNCTKREDSSRCSVFSFDVNANRSRLPIARNAVRKARTLRHPGVVKVVDTIETDTNLYIVTERLTPLTWHTRRKSLAEETIKWGLCGVARTMKFLNEEAASVHGTLRAASIFLSDSGEWKVGGFDLLSSVRDEEAVIFRYSSLVPNLGPLMPPEVGRGGWDVLKNNPAHAVDSFDYGLLVAECFNGAFIPADQAAQAPNIPSEMQQTYRRFFHANPKARLSTANFLDQGRRSGGFFQTPLINLTEGVDKLGLMSDGERDEFFSELDDVSGDFPEDFMTRKILPELIKSVEFGGGGPKVFNVVLQIGAKLGDDEYNTQLTPVLIRLFSRQDRAMRVCLLENMHLMVDRLSSKIINDKIFPSLVTGFTDQAPLLREQTVKSTLTIVGKLSDRTVNGELLKYLAKTANDPEPGIRTNTTICLGKMAKNMSASTRSKVLIAAFSRSLRDPFMHARNAALLALGATTEMFTEDDCATKILPALCPSLVDKEKLVRDQANKTLETYLARVRKFATTLPDTVTPATNGAPTGPRMSTPTPSTDATWTGWAISSFTNKLATASGEMSSKPPPVRVGGASTPQPVTLQPTSSSLPATRPASAASNNTLPVKPPLPRNATSQTKLAASFTAPEVVEDDWADNWGLDDSGTATADDAWSAMAADTAPLSTTTPTIRTATHSPTPSTTSATTAASEILSPSSPAPSDTPKPAPKKKVENANASGEPDFASWLNSQKGAKTAKALPKGLSSTKSSGSVATRGSVATGTGSLGTGTGRPVAGRTSTGSSLGGKRVVQVPAPKKEEEKKGEGEGEDDWGESW